MTAPNQGPRAAVPGRFWIAAAGPVLWLLCGGLALSGCRTPLPHDGVEVDILEGHRHSAYCGHFYYGFAWYFVKDHHHGEDCGHVLRYGQWTIE